MKKIILHVGYPKAGSTSLQRYMFDNREALAERGILYPISPNMKAINQRNIAHQLSLRKRDSLMFDKGGVTLESIKQEFQSFHADVLIISSEIFLRMAWVPERFEPLIKLARETRSELEVFAFVRPQHVWLNSSYAERTKWLNNRKRFANFFEAMKEAHVTHVSEVIGAWDEVPQARVIVKPFTSRHLKPNLPSVFFDAVGLQDRVEPLMTSQTQTAQNESLGPKTLEACRRVATKLTGRLDMEADAQSFHTLRSLSLRLITACRQEGWNSERFNGLTNRMRDQIHAIHHANNNKFALRHWGRPWDEVFIDDYERDFQTNEFIRNEDNLQEHRQINRVIRKVCNAHGIEIEI